MFPIPAIAIKNIIEFLSPEEQAVVEDALFAKSQLLAVRGAIKMAGECISCFPRNFSRKRQCSLYVKVSESFIFSAVGKALCSEQRITSLFYIILGLPREMQGFCHSHLVSVLVCFYPGRKELIFSLLQELAKSKNYDVIEKAVNWSRDSMESARYVSLLPFKNNQTLSKGKKRDRDA